MLNLSAAIDYHARVSPQRQAIAFEDLVITYAALSRRAAQVAAFLIERGVRQGDVVAVRMKNSPAFYDLIFGASRSGAILLPINFRLSAQETRYILDNSGARILFVDDELAADVGFFPAVVSLNEASRRDLTFAGICGRPVPPAVPARAEDIFRLMYTSGTTSQPKGVVHTYANVHWKNLDLTVALGLDADTRLLVAGPLFHVGGFDAPGCAVLLLGGFIRLLRQFEPAAALDAISDDGLTGAWLAPVMLHRLLEAGAGGRNLRSLQWCIGGGERTPEERIRAFGSLFPCARYIDAYGLTETCSCDTLMEAGRELEKIGSVGRPVAHIQLRICDDAGTSLPPRTDGEVCIQGPKVTQGYWRDAEKTASSFFPDGWFRTGDIGHLDEDGFLYLTDRKKDMIISGGENIASSEVERVLYALSQVSEAAVIGMPCPRWGERPVAVVVLKPGTTLSYDEIVRHCQQHLARFKVPDRLILRDALPRNPSGKVLKRLLRDEYAGKVQS